MPQALMQIALVVEDYDEAIRFFTETLDFRLIEDTPIDSDKRWVVISPHGEHGANVLLAKAKNEYQRQAIGHQSGGRVFLFLMTDDLQRDYQTYVSRGVHFERQPEEHDYGKVAVFADLYGNLWDLIEPTEHHPLAETVRTK